MDRTFAVCGASLGNPRFFSLTPVSVSSLPISDENEFQKDETVSSEERKEIRLRLRVLSFFTGMPHLCGILTLCLFACFAIYLYTVDITF
jgi:hypothetical protein